MNSSNNNALPTWLFIATDLALIGAATVIAVRSPHPLPASAILWIVACVGLGAIVGLVPLLVRYERQKNEALDERQIALEALARTIGSSADQISIATNGLHEIAELAHKNLRHADQLPHKLQDKMAELQSQLAANADAEKEELERELLALRTSESERLDSVSQRIAKSSAEWAKLEAATHQHLIAANEAVAKLAHGTAGAISKSQAAAEQALSAARVEVARALGDASGKAARDLESARASALAEFDARLAAASALLVERVTTELSARLAGMPGASTREPGSQEPPPSPPALSSPARTETPSAAVASSVTPETASATPATDQPRRTRKPRRDESATNGADDHAKPGVESPAPAETQAAPAEEAWPDFAEEPPPVPGGTIPEISPVAPSTAEPFSGHIASVPSDGATPAPAESPVAEAAPKPPAEAAKSPRKRTAKNPERHDEPGLGLELDESAAGFTSGTAERVLTSDGATRLLVTAYIGIGNRLYIRGDGPGLSWEKGSPLQFVSIGKWRWETNDATAPVRFKLYKNDDLECSALGAQSLDPGHQQEVTAAF